ncbi:hypothetical protein [Paenibacillus assamensis]|uniref:hypothetical protein n=1 Tax=Paenibacillus assamensis TaxID=311244 RepID=UPI0004230018|nr:hypothetical protein [Paenibacillus assamensis]
MNIDKLYRAYIALKVPNPFTLDDIDKRLKQRYKAKEVDVNCFADLAKDPCANFKDAVKAYKFRDKTVIEEIFKFNDETGTFLGRNYLKNNLIIESKDGIYMSAATCQGGSGLLMCELRVFGGIEKEQQVVGNQDFEYYLKCLYLAGYIQFENDSYYEVACQRMRMNRDKRKIDIF